jgi:hypothetical protein
MWTYMGVNVFPAAPNSAGTRWYARIPGRPVLRAGTQQSMRELAIRETAAAGTATARERARAVKPGMTVKFAEPVDFGDGRVHDTLTLVVGSTFRGPDGRLYKVPNWRTRYAWEVAR